MIRAAGPLTIEWLNQIKNKNRKTLKISEIDYFIQLLDDFYIQNGTAEDPYFYDDLKRAIKYEISENKYGIDYIPAYSNYKDVYESIKDNLSCYKLSQAKKIFETKMSEMLYNDLRDSYKSKKYDGDCCICLKKIDADETITICKHYFHKKCINKWMERKKECQH